MVSLVRKYFHKQRLNLFLAFGTGLLLLAILFWQGQVGLSNNGDFSRAMRPNGIHFVSTPTERSFVFENIYRMEFSGRNAFEKFFGNIFGIKDLLNYPSTQHVFIKMAIVVNLLINLLTSSDIHIFRLSVLGVIYCFFYSLAFYFVFTSIQSKKLIVEIFCKCLLVLVACDIGYVIYFNSFYGEALQGISLLFIIGFWLKLFLNKNPQKKVFLFYLLSVCFFGGSKFANIPFAITLALAAFFGVFFQLKEQRRFLTLLTLVALAFLALTYTAVPKWMDKETTYNALFFGALKDTTPEQAKEYLEEIQHPSYMLKLRGTNYYAKSVSSDISTRKFQEDFSNLSKSSLLLFYIKHPAFFLQKLHVNALNSGSIKPVYLSNYTLEKPRLTFSNKFELWGTLRKLLPYTTIWWQALVYISFLIMVAILKIRQERKDKNLLLLLSVAAVSFGILINFCLPLIANGEGDIAKHMFAFIQLMDFLTLVLVVFSINEVVDFMVHKRQQKITLCKAILPCIVLLLILFAIVPQVYAYYKNLNEDNKPYSTAKVGCYIRMGQWNSKNLLWQVIDDTKNELTLLAVDSIHRQPFFNTNSKSLPSKYGDNLWSTSSIREWLNAEFFNSFSFREKFLLLKKKHKFLLSAAYLSLKTGGSNDFYWSHIPQIADSGYEDAYFSICDDFIQLPDIQTICATARKGLRITRNSCYWTQTPYFRNENRVRTVNTDGYIYMSDASCKDIGVLPMIVIPKNICFSGKGNISNPFFIDDSSPFTSFVMQTINLYKK